MIVTPGKIYRALGKSADCGGCMPLFLSTMRSNENLKVFMQPPILKGSATQDDGYGHETPATVLSGNMVERSQIAYLGP